MSRVVFVLDDLMEEMRRINPNAQVTIKLDAKTFDETKYEAESHSGEALSDEEFEFIGAKIERA